MKSRATVRRASVSFAPVLTALAALGLVFSLAHCVSDQNGPVVAVDGGTVVDEASVVSNAYSIAGIVSGLPATATVTLSLNGGSPLDAKDGAFVFPVMLLSGQSYTVTAKSNAAGYTCLVANGSGTIAMTAVANVAVTCTSNDATLSSLTVSTSPLTPVFAPQTAAYTAAIRTAYPFGYMSTPAPTTITATPNDPGATITVNGVATKASTPSAPITVNAGTNAIDVTVTASDKTTQKHYAIAAAGILYDYFKPPNTTAGENFGFSVAISNDGNTLAVGEGGGTGGVDVFTRSGSSWSLQKRLTAINVGFGRTVALSADGNTLAVGAHLDQSKATGINGDQNDHSLMVAGAAYVLVRTGTTWTQQAYIKPSYVASYQYFGNQIALSADGNTLAVGTIDSSGAIGIGGDPSDTSALNSGSVFVFTRAGGTTWSQQTYIKASNTRANASFGSGVGLSSDGNTLAVGSYGESSNATTIGGSQTDTSAMNAGAAYIFTRAATTWSQQAYIKASDNNPGGGAEFGRSLALANDGNTMAVTTFPQGGTGANTGIYVFTRAGAAWSQLTKIMSAGGGVSLSADGNTLAIGNNLDSSNATGIDGNQTDTSLPNSGAAFVLTRSGSTFTQLHYVKPSFPRMNGGFGFTVAISGDTKTLAVGDNSDASAATGINGNQTDTSVISSGAVFVY
jgi:hypothetical protein